jgi:beta-glucosidase
MARAAVVGLQGFDLSHPLAVAACAKHFAGDGGTAKGTSTVKDAIFDRGNTNTGSDQALRAIHLAPYKAVLEVGVASIMASFSQWNGVPMHANATLLTDWLKAQNRFQGWVCGDYDGHTAVGGGEEACMTAGLDMAMHAGTAPSKLDNVYTAMYQAGGDKKTRVLDAARRVLRMKMLMGLFDRPPRTDPAITALAGCQLHRDVARACVRESMVLLKNEGTVLPLKKSARVHLIGSHADNLGYQCGGWTLGWAEQNLANENFIGATTIKAGFEKLAPGKITYASNANTIPSDADVVVVVFGEKVHAEWFGDSDNLGPQDWKIMPGDADVVPIIEQAKKANKPVIGLLISSRPLIASGYLNNLKAFVCAWLPGTEGGGIAEVMYGDYDFKGTLPHTWPASFSQEPCNATAPEYGGDLGDLKGASGAPQWAYGFGLSYKNGTLRAPF